MEEDPVRTGGRIVLAMFGIGVGIALAIIFTAEWVSTTIVPGLGAAEEQVVTAYTPLAFIAISAIGAPLVAGVIGVSEGTRSSTTKHAVTVGVACLLGAVLLVSLAGAGVAISDTSAPSADDGGNGGNGGDSGDGDNGGDDGTNDTADNGTNESTDDSGGSEEDDSLPGIVELVGLAGLCGVTSLVSGFITTKSGV